MDEALRRTSAACPHPSLPPEGEGATPKATAMTADQWIATAEQLLKSPDQDRLNRGLELARQSGWENTVKTMQDLIKQAIGKSDRRSGKKIEPMSEAELSYQYQHTPGS